MSLKNCFVNKHTLGGLIVIIAMYFLFETCCFILANSRSLLGNVHDLSYISRFISFWNEEFTIFGEKSICFIVRPWDALFLFL